MRYLLALSSLLLFVPPALAGPPRDDVEEADTEVEEWTDMTPKTRGADLFRAEMMREHNLARHSAGLPSLIWDEALAADAAAYARTLATTRRFQHATRVAGKPVQGENLWVGTRSAFAYRDMTGAWIEERQDFVRGIFPDVSRTGSWHDVGHYTQMIWGGTRSVGCGLATNAENEVLVCRYFPAGNVMGDSPLEP
jgi:Cysteine-rich secretory protein family